MNTVTEVSDRISEPDPGGDRAGQGRGRPKGHHPAQGHDRGGRRRRVRGVRDLHRPGGGGLGAQRRPRARVPGSIWEGFAIVFGALAVLAVLSFVIASRLLKRGAPPTPTMAIDEAKRIRETVATRKRGGGLMATRTPGGDPGLDRAEPPGARALAREAARRGGPSSWTGGRRCALHQREVLIGAGVAGFVLGGGIAALSALAFGGRRRRQGRR